MHSTVLQLNVPTDPTASVGSFDKMAEHWPPADGVPATLEGAEPCSSVKFGMELLISIN